MALVQRLVNVVFQLGQGSFGGAGGGANSVSLSGLRVSAKIVKAGGRSLGQAELRIYGMQLQMMNQLSTLGMRIQLVPRNGVTITAGDDSSGMATVFQGSITNAYADFGGAPDVPFIVQAHTGLPAAVVPAKASSFSGSVDVATIMQGLASQMQLGFENNGVMVKLSSPYFSGSPLEQARACAKQANISMTIDVGSSTSQGTLIIWPRNGSRGGQIPLIAPPPLGQMIGYPTYTAMGIMLKTLFDPTVGLGGKIQVTSSLTPASKTWAVYGLDHTLETMVPRGKWESTIMAYDPGFSPPVLQ